MNVRVLALASAVVLVSCAPKKRPQNNQNRDDAGAERRGDAPNLPAPSVTPELLVLRQVLVEESSDQGSLRLPAGAMAKELGRQLVTSGFVAARDSDVPRSHRPRRVEVLLQMSYDWAPDAEPEAGALVLAAEARVNFVEGRGDLAPQVSVLMQAAVPRIQEAPATQADQAQQALERLAETAITSMSESLVARERLRGAPDAELLSALSIGLKEPSMRIWALQLAADRGLTEAVPAAIADLSSDDENLQAAAVATLVELRDPRAVPALVKDVDFNNYEELGVTLEAISAIGGDEAREFLEFVASGHPDQDLQARAKENLQRLRGDASP